MWEEDEIEMFLYEGEVSTDVNDIDELIQTMYEYDGSLIT